jgi:hypothetical protein
MYIFRGSIQSLQPRSIQLRTPLPDLPVDFANELLAKLCSCGTFADRLLRAGASPAKRLRAQIHSPRRQGKPCREVHSLTAMCNHPLDNNIEFHLPFSRIPTIRTLLGARNVGFAQAT